MPGPATGHSMKLYYNTGTNASPTWAEIESIGDLSIPNLSRGTADLKRRGNDWTKALASLIQATTVEFRFPHGLNATDFDVLRAAFFAATVQEYAIMDGDIATSGSEGLRLPALVENFPWDQPLEDVSGHDVGLKLAYMEESSTEIDPAWLVVA